MQAASTVWLHLRFGCHFSGFHAHSSLCSDSDSDFVCLLDAQILLRRLGLNSLYLLHSFSLSLSSIRNETDNCMFWLPPAIVLPLPLGSACVAVAVTVAVAAAAAGVLRWLCTCDNIFIIFASFLLPLLRCHRHRRIANGRCVCKH